MFISNTKFLGLVITNSLSWKDHITQLTPKLCRACYVLGCIRPFMSQDTLKSVYYSYYHSHISYRIIFCGNSSNVLHVFRLQKRAVRIITGSRPRHPCRGLFKKLRILPLQSQYILSLSLFIVNNKNLFHVCIRKGLTIRALNFCLLSSIKKLSCDVKRFRLDLGKYLHLKSFCTLEKYFSSTKS